MKISFCKPVIFVALLVFASSVNGQTTIIENLKQSIASANTARDSLKAIFSFCAQWRNLPVDTVDKWAAFGENIAYRLRDEEAIWTAGYYRQTSLLKKGAYDSVLANFAAAEDWLNAKPEKYWNLRSDFGLLKANVLIRSNRYKDALAVLYQLRTLSENAGDTLAQIKTMSTIGWAYLEMQQYRQALSVFKKALSITDNNSFFDNYGVLYSNIATTYNNLGKFDSAFSFITKAITVARKTESLSNLCNALNIQADIFLNLKKIDEARIALDEALEIRRKIGDPFYTISDIAQVAMFYSQIGMPRQGIALCDEALQLCRQYSLPSKLPFIYAAYAENYKTKGDYKAYSKTLESLIAIKDSLYQINSAEALANLQAKYNVQKKENIIIQQRMQLVRRDYWISIFAAAVSGSFLIALVLYKKYKKTQQEKFQHVLDQQIKQSVIAVFDAEENQRQRIAAELHDNIGSQISYISSNIKWILDPPMPLTALEQKERLGNINETSQSLIRNMRETIWALNSSQILLDEFSDKLKAYIQSAIKMQPGLVFQPSEALDKIPVTLTPIQALNLFRIFQEAVNNTIKYAEANTLSLQIKSEGSHYCIELVDDGKGFESDNINGEHYGLRNMRFRAKESGVKLTINSSPGNGTSILVKS